VSPAFSLLTKSAHRSDERFHIDPRDVIGAAPDSMRDSSSSSSTS
jgi:hypothetical protein